MIITSLTSTTGLHNNDWQEIRAMDQQKKPEWLLDYAANTHSQSGEDGIIDKILSMLPERNQWCVEFGAWDGKYMCNTLALIERGYHAVMIEGNNGKYKELKSNHAGNEKVIPVNAFVGFDVEDGLDSILSKYPVPADFDFLSIDIDGNDYHTWKAVEKYRPKLVCIEFNPTIPSEVSFIQDADPDVSQGCSLLAMTELARTKGYELVCVIPFNAFFVDKIYYPLFGITDNSPHKLRRDTSDVTWIFTLFEGTMQLAGSRVLPWHGIYMNERKLQTVPKFIRKFPGHYNPLQRLALSLLKRVGWLRSSRRKRKK